MEPGSSQSPQLDAETIEPAIDCVQSQSHKNKAKRKKCDTSSEDALLQKALAAMQKPVDEFQIFADYVAQELRALKFQHNRNKLKRLIQRAILDISQLDDEQNYPAEPTLQTPYSSCSSHSDISDIHYTNL